MTNGEDQTREEVAKAMESVTTSRSKVECERALSNLLTLLDLDPDEEATDGVVRMVDSVLAANTETSRRGRVSMLVEVATGRQRAAAAATAA